MYLQTHKIIQETQLHENTIFTTSRRILIKESDALCEKYRSHDKSVCETFRVRQTQDSNPSSDMKAGPPTRESKPN